MDKNNIRKKTIIEYTQVLKNTVKSNNPIEIAEHFKYKISYMPDPSFVLKAKAVKYNNNNNIILINECYSAQARMVVCAHELGHIILHKGSHKYNGSDLDCEYEANLFAVALLFEQEDFNINLTEMSNYHLKSILDYNLK